MDLTIRRATAADVPALAELRHAFTFEDPEPSVELRDGFEDAFEEVVGAGITNGRWAVWVAEADGEIVSHVFVGLIDKIPRPIRQDRWLGYVTNVYTRPEHRGRGIGAALLGRVTSWAAEQHVELLVVWPSEESVEFYERAGFSSGRDPLVWVRE
jgi:GNAT superfamily N-acetyltransferase